MSQEIIEAGPAILAAKIGTINIPTPTMVEK
jgi:hypothetical protein